MDWGPIALIAGAYMLGCLNAGYYIVRWRSGADIRTLGTGTAGARNAGRQLGKLGFVVTLLLDATKGGAAVAAARWLDLGTVSEMAAMLAAVSGHIWPAQLGFRGGKGLATATGAMLVFDPLVVGVAAVLAAFLVLAIRRVTVPGLAGVASVPVVAIAVGRSGTEIVGASALAVVVLFAHRANIVRQFSRGPTRQVASNALSSLPEERRQDEQHGSDLQNSV